MGLDKEIDGSGFRETSEVPSRFSVVESDMKLEGSAFRDVSEGVVDGLSTVFNVTKVLSEIGVVSVSVDVEVTTSGMDVDEVGSETISYSVSSEFLLGEDVC